MPVPRLLLILDDDRARLRGFDEIASRLGQGWVVKSWRDAPTMLSELERHLEGAQLISLDHDLYRDSPADPDPGSGREVADYLSRRKPACPVILHSTNTDAAWGMHNVLRAGGWTVELVHHLGEPKWIEERWLPAAARLAASPAEGASTLAAGALDLAGYRALVKPLPIPTPAQVREFAQYVAGAHSWYKHLPVLPANSAIQIFLDPAAGMQLTAAADGSVAAAPRDKPGFHYSWLRTDEYRERFGHLAFSRSAGTSVALMSADGSRLIGADDAPRAYDPSARVHRRLPEEALLAGRAFISAIVHESGSARNLWERVIERSERFDDVLERVDGLDVGKRILDRCRELKEDPSSAEPAPPAQGDEFHRWTLASLDVSLQHLVQAERRRQIDGLAAAAERVIRLVAPRA